MQCGRLTARQLVIDIPILKQFLNHSTAKSTLSEKKPITTMLHHTIIPRQKRGKNQRTTRWINAGIERSHRG